MKIVCVASEMVPFAKTGGLADVVGTLSKELQLLGHEVLTFLPNYRGIDLQKYGFQPVLERLEVQLGSQTEIGRIYHALDECGMHIYLVDHAGFFQRDMLYGSPLEDYPDNDRRFAFFQKAVLETLKAIHFAPDVIHCHDWQSGLIPAYLKTSYASELLFKKTRSVFTIHNLAYQGNFPPDSMPMLGFGWEEFKYEKMEFYGKVSFIKAGIVYSDSLTTVSERYAEEIRTQEFGCGMEKVFATRPETIYGVVNGIDVKEWDPNTDKDIAANYSVDDFSKKVENKKALQQDNRFEVNASVPVVGIVSRLVDQKGLDILIPAMEKMAMLGVQLVLLGTGEEKYHKLLRSLAKKNRKQFGVHIVFDPKMAKQIYAGADILVVPSYYEPCGLGQMIALRYGTIPVVRETGGLSDTITEFDPKELTGNGFLFKDYTSDAFMIALEKAVTLFHDDSKWKKLVSNAMKMNFSWNSSAKKYISIFEETLKRKKHSSK
jgi:starch synthase